MKKEFPAAMVKKVYRIQGLDGNYKMSGYREAKDNPNSERARKGSKVCWFIPDNEYPEQHDDEIIDLTEGIEE